MCGGCSRDELLGGGRDGGGGREGGEGADNTCLKIMVQECGEGGEWVGGREEGGGEGGGREGRGREGGKETGSNESIREVTVCAPASAAPLKRGTIPQRFKLFCCV